MKSGSIKLKEKLINQFGPIERESKLYLYKSTEYYCGEMGDRILRQLVSFENCFPWEQLADLKVQTNQLETELSEEEKRKVNLDCGLLSLDKIVVASTKPASYRIYLRDGIYAQATYWYEKGSFQAWPWTYDEYQSFDIIRFFNLVRTQYRKTIRHIRNKIS